MPVSKRHLLTSGSWNIPKVDLGGCVFYAPLWRPDKAGNPFQSSNVSLYPCTVIGAIWGSQGRTFDGTDDEISTPQDDSKPSLSPPSITVEAWVNAVSFDNNYNSVIGYELPAKGYTMLVKSTGKLAIYTALGNYDGTGTYTLTAGLWYHLVMTNDATNLMGYVNGLLDNSVASGGSIVSVTGGAYFYIGQSVTASREWKGLIGEIRVYNRVLSVTEIWHNYQTTKWRYN